MTINYIKKHRMPILVTLLCISLFVDLLWFTRDNKYTGVYIGEVNKAVITVNKNHTFVSSSGYRGTWFYKDGVIVLTYKTSTDKDAEEFSEEMIVIPSGGVLNNQYFTRKR